MIAFVGSVFSPYYHWAGCREPENHVAINVCLYGRGVRRWAMTERGRAALARDAASFSVGPSSLVWDGESLRLDLDEIGAPIPRRVRGSVRIHPEAINLRHYALDGDGRHRWGPIAPIARVEARFSHPDLAFSGHAYVDTNDGTEPLARAFATWDWSRCLADGRCVTLYDAVMRDDSRRSLSLAFDSAGDVHALASPPRVALPPGPIWRVARGLQSDAGATVIETLEDTPFYTRSLLATSIGGRPVTAMHESLDCRRLDTAIVRMMLPFRMPRRGGVI